MSKHTPGPWKIGFADGSGADEECYWITDKDEEAVVRGGEHDMLPLGVQKLEDAQLIAAAPDQNAVLKQLAERIETCPTCDGSGTEINDPESACHTCGGIGRVLDATSLIQDIEEAINKAKID